MWFPFFNGRNCFFAVITIRLEIRDKFGSAVTFRRCLSPYRSTIAKRYPKRESTFTLTHPCEPPHRVVLHRVVTTREHNPIVLYTYPNPHDKCAKVIESGCAPGMYSICMYICTYICSVYDTRS